MRHRNSISKLNRTAAHRRALMKNLATSLIEEERVVTTEAKAKALRPYAERLITLGKRGTLHARRQAMRWIHGRPVAKKLFEELAPRYKSRQGGYTRIVKVGARAGDAAPMAMIQLLAAGEKSRKELGARKKKRSKDGSKARVEASALPESPTGV
ncbi:MAG: 50S ribosomal protein L17 [Deltaproteobacteria bacterium]|jgi:large subunit ribosomal protein L17|nr:50S ribosomal protein L17 [Deltaproteobacteria bacterium]